MLPYWVLFGLFALTALTERSRPPGGSQAGPLLAGLIFFMTLMIGLRFHVGGDFETYQTIFDDTVGVSLGEALERGDPGYQFVNWLVGVLGGGVWQVNLICAAIFTWGLIRLCRAEPVPSLAVLVAIPYLVVVVAMGYTRQAVAIGVIMAGIASLSRNGSILRFAAYVGVAALFHKTAVVVLPLAIFAGRRNHVLNFVALVGAGLGLYFSLLDDSVDTLVTNYVDAAYSSDGALIRVVMNLVPAILILAKGHRMYFKENELRLWRMFAIISLVMLPLLFVIASSTAIDRIALYMLPIQIVGIGRALYLFDQSPLGRLGVITYCAAVLLVWLIFATHAFAWIPYRLTPVWA